MYADYPKGNAWISRKSPLSSSEYANAVKISCNLTAVRSVPGRAFNTTRCRQIGCNETETLGHVLGFCRSTELLRNNRHHRVRSSIAQALRQRGWEVHEEVHCVSTDDSTRRADIVAIKRDVTQAMVLDPTIRFERDLRQASEVDVEKQAIYTPCLPYLAEKYNIPIDRWNVQGLMFGARGSLPNVTGAVLKNLHLSLHEIESILINIIRDSLQIIHFHLYLKQN